MMFKFNFECSKPTKAVKSLSTNSNNENEEKAEKPLTMPSKKQKRLNWIESQRISVTDDHFSSMQDFSKSLLDIYKFYSEKVEVQCLNEDGVSKNLENKNLSFSATLSHSDLEPSVYEGGLKIWECTWDLLKFVEEKNLDFKDTKVLELGCGAGLPGILALRRGASVTFQDYNEEVLDCITIPNVLVNLQSDGVISANQVNHSFYFGDWENLDKLLIADNDSLFDIILTSETIYNPVSQVKLLKVFKNCLKQDGVVFVAAKSHYFGVGGGTFDFTQLIERENNFSVQSVITHKEGVQREILILKRL